MAELLGNVELIMWNLPDAKTDKPSLNRVREQLACVSFPQERATDIPAGTAFRRALDELRDKQTLVRPFERKHGELKTLCAQIDRERFDEARDSLVREKVGVYLLDPERVKESQVYTTNGDCQETLQTLRIHYVVASVTYTWSDVSKVIQECLKADGLGAYSPRRAGGVYFAPVSPNSRDLLDRIERFATALGVRFLRYGVPDTDAQRAEVAEAIATSLQADISAHRAAIEAYDQHTRPGVMSNRREAIAQTSGMIARLTSLLSDRANGLIVEISSALDVLAAKEAAVAANVSAPTGGRRIIQSNPIP